MNLILLGAPGAGKGTLSETLVEKLGIPAISTGNILREAIRNHTKLGDEAKSYMDAGQLVPDAVVIGMLKERIAQEDCQNGYILDGFPRTIPQAEELDKVASIDCALSLEVSDAEIETRMSGRRVCAGCGAVYHTVNKPSKTEGVCDKCEGALEIRKDDEISVVRNRLATYHEQTEPLIAYYEAQGKLKSINGERPIEATVAQALAALEK